MDGNTLAQTLGIGIASGEFSLPNYTVTGSILDMGGKSNMDVQCGTGTYYLQDVPRGHKLTVSATGVVTIKSRANVTIVVLGSGDRAELQATSSTTWTVMGGKIQGVTLASLGTSLTSTQGRSAIKTTEWREVSSGAVTNTAGGGGVLSSNTTPTLTPVNGATDSTQIITWAASGVDPLLAVVELPLECNSALGATMAFNATIKSGGTTNAVGFTVKAFTPDGVVIADAVATGTNQTTTYANVTAAFDLSGGDYSGMQYVTVVITPVTHGSDTLVMKSAWLSYSKRILTS